MFDLNDGLHQRKCPRCYRHLCAALNYRSWRPGNCWKHMGPSMNVSKETANSSRNLHYRSFPSDHVAIEMSKSSFVWLMRVKRRHRKYTMYSVNYSYRITPRNSRMSVETEAAVWSLQESCWPSENKPEGRWTHSSLSCLPLGEEKRSWRWSKLNVDKLICLIEREILSTTYWWKCCTCAGSRWW